MKMTVRKLLIHVLCILVIICIQQVASQIPQDITVQKTSTSACHGIASTETTMNATCGAGQVIAIKEITMGAKPIELDCPLYWNSTYNTDCCTHNSSEDCTFPFFFNEQYHNLCNGNNNCEQVTQFQQIVTECDSFNGAYGALGQYSHYMFMDFYCVPDNHIVDMCTTDSTTATSDTVYIWNKNFATHSIQQTDTSCECSVEIDNCEAEIHIFKIYRNLAERNDTCEQNITIYDADSGLLNAWDCNDNNLNFEMVPVSQTYIVVTLDNEMDSAGGKFWLGFRASNVSNITVSCPAKPQTNCILSTTTNPTTTDMTSTTTETPTTSTEIPTTTTEIPTTTTEVPTTSTEIPTTSTDFPTTTTEASTTTTEVPTTTTTEIPTTTTVEETTTNSSTTEDNTHTAAQQDSDTNNGVDGLLIAVIVLVSICIILLIVVIILCVRRNKKMTKDAENPGEKNPVAKPESKSKPEVARIDFKSSKTVQNYSEPPESVLHGVSNGNVIHATNVSKETSDAICQTHLTEPNGYPTNTSVDVHMVDMETQTDAMPLISRPETEDADIQTTFDMPQKLDKHTSIVINVVHQGMQTDNRSKHKKPKITTNKIYPTENNETTNEPIQQNANSEVDYITVEEEKHLTRTQDGQKDSNEPPRETISKNITLGIKQDQPVDLVETSVPKLDTDNPYSNEEPNQRKKKKKKKRKHEKHYDEDTYDEIKLRDVDSEPDQDHVDNPESAEHQAESSNYDRYSVPHRYTPNQSEPSSEEQSDMESRKTTASSRVYDDEENKIRKAIKKGFYSPEKAAAKLEKYYRKCERRKHKKKRSRSRSETKIE